MKSLPLWVSHRETAVILQVNQNLGVLLIGDFYIEHDLQGTDCSVAIGGAQTEKQAYYMATVTQRQACGS